MPVTPSISGTGSGVSASGGEEEGGCWDWSREFVVGGIGDDDLGCEEVD